MIRKFFQIATLAILTGVLGCSRSSETQVVIAPPAAPELSEPELEAIVPDESLNTESDDTPQLPDISDITAPPEIGVLPGEHPGEHPGGHPDFGFSVDGENGPVLHPPSFPGINMKDGQPELPGLNPGDLTPHPLPLQSFEGSEIPGLPTPVVTPPAPQTK